QKIIQTQNFIDRTTLLAILPEEFPRLRAAFPNNPAIELYTRFSAFALSDFGTVRPRADRPFDTVVLGGQSFRAAAVERAFP
ncbi:hypothetical protein WAJ71_22175, partial [Acinetobacter baumannii]